MRAHILIAVIAITMPWTTQAEQSLTADGYLAQPGSVDAPAANGDRVGLINDGSFEFGECENGSAWTCTTNTDCSWIINPSGLWGYPAYDGILCAWLGGFCGSEFNLNTFCQEILFDGMYLDWYWMGYNSGHFTLSIDGVQVFGWVSSHTYGEWNLASEAWLDGEPGVDVSAWCGESALLCFENFGSTNASLLIDYITLNESCLTSVEPTSISTIKSRYP